MHETSSGLIQFAGPMATAATVGGLAVVARVARARESRRLRNTKRTSHDRSGIRKGRGSRGEPNVVEGASPD